MLLYVLVRLKECFRQTPPPPLPADCMLPELTLFITAYNEEDVVDDKMRNSLSLDYPADKLHILWITDGSNDRTNDKGTGRLSSAQCPLGLQLSVQMSE